MSTTLPEGFEAFARAKAPFLLDPLDADSDTERLTRTVALMAWQAATQVAVRTLRDEFAGKALPLADALASYVYGFDEPAAGWEHIAREAYAIADAMLKARQA